MDLWAGPVFQRHVDVASGAGSVDGASFAEGGAGFGQRLAVDAVTGLINSIVSLPIMMSFAVIIYGVRCVPPGTAAGCCLCVTSFSIVYLAATQQ